MAEIGREVVGAGAKPRTADQAVLLRDSQHPVGSHAFLIGFIGSIFHTLEQPQQTPAGLHDSDEVTGPERGSNLPQATGQAVS